MRKLTTMLCFSGLFMLLTSPALTQNIQWGVNNQLRKEISFPDILEYQTFLSDLHQHTVFSDGLVWPTVRVDEAWREGLEVIAITDHLEYQPHKEDIPTNHNRPYELASRFAEQRNILMIRGSEITKDTPPGHYNAIFLQDSDPIVQDNVLDAARIATEQGAFVFWNHTGWKGAERGRWEEVQDTLHENNWLHGIEVANGGSYFEDAHRYAIEHNLTMMGSSDIHQPSMLRFSSPEEHRTMTLIFATEQTPEAIKEALLARRTVVWYKNQLIGREEFLRPLLTESLRIQKHQTGRNSLGFLVTNISDVPFELERIGSQGPAEITIPARATIQVTLRADEPVDEVQVRYRVKNLLVAPGEGLEIEASIPLDGE